MVTGRAPVLVAGAINTDLVATVNRAPGPGETITGTGFAIHGGGKAANQAVALARSGGDAQLVGSIGADDFGRARLAELNRNGVNTGWVVVSDQVASGVALILVEESGENRIAYVPGATLTVSESHPAAACDAIVPAFVLATNELSHDSLARLFEGANAGGAKVVFNAAPDPESARDLLSLVSMLIVNEVEAAALLDMVAIDDASSAVAQLRSIGIETVLLTMGRDGAFVGDEYGIEHHRPPEVKVVDTTGAGDTFCGAFVAELARSASTRDAVRYAVTASALSVTKAGAQSSIPNRDDVLAKLASG